MLKAHTSLLHSYTTSTAKKRVTTDTAFNKTVQICRVPFVSGNVHVYLTVKTRFEQVSSDMELWTIGAIQERLLLH